VGELAKTTGSEAPDPPSFGVLSREASRRPIFSRFLSPAESLLAESKSPASACARILRGSRLTDSASMSSSSSGPIGPPNPSSSTPPTPGVWERRARPEPRAAIQPERGTITVFAAILALVLIGLMGLALDTAWVLTAREQLQLTADAAALAAAAQIEIPGQSKYNLVRRAARLTARQNGVVGCATTGVELEPNLDNDPRGDIVVGRWRYDPETRNFFLDPTDPAPDAVKVHARCGPGSRNPALRLFFGYLFGQRTSQGGPTAIAKLGRTEDPLIFLLDPVSAGALSITGGAHLNVQAGTIQVDSNNPCALSISGQSGLLAAQIIQVVGGSCLNNSGNLQGRLIEDSRLVRDPLASLAEPIASNLGSVPAITTGGDFAPGYYRGGISLSSGTARLRPGVYIIGPEPPGLGVDITHHGAIQGDGVMIFLQNGARLHTADFGSMVLTPPRSGTYRGVTVFQARSNANLADLKGDGTTDLAGILYLPAARLAMTGDIGRRLGKILVQRVSISDDGDYVFTRLGLPPRVDPRSVFLVR
jgi:hypothetical protein